MTQERPNRNVSRRTILKGAAGVAASVPLAGLPIAGNAATTAGPAPSVTETPQPEPGEDGSAFRRQAHLGYTRDYESVLVPIDYGRFPGGALHIPSSHADYKIAIDAINKNHRRERQWREAHVAHHRVSWVWGVPASMREAVLDLAESIERSVWADVENDLCNYFFISLADRIPDVDVNDRDYTHDEMVGALRQPTTLAAVLLELSNVLGIDVEEYFSQRYVVAMREVAAS